MGNNNMKLLKKRPFKSRTSEFNYVDLCNIIKSLDLGPF